MLKRHYTIQYRPAGGTRWLPYATFATRDEAEQTLRTVDKFKANDVYARIIQTGTRV